MRGSRLFGELRTAIVIEPPVSAEGLEQAVSVAHASTQALKPFSPQALAIDFLLELLKELKRFDGRRAVDVDVANLLAQFLIRRRGAL